MTRIPLAEAVAAAVSQRIKNGWQGGGYPCWGNCNPSSGCGLKDCSGIGYGDPDGRGNKDGTGGGGNYIIPGRYLVL